MLYCLRFYHPGRHDQYQGTELGVDSVLCMPIMDLEDNVMGVVELINKEGIWISLCSGILVVSGVYCTVAKCWLGFTL